MELGQRIRSARLEAGLSQRALCGEAITRNMLSQIENGAARPSMDTLRYLAGRLGKSVSYFLEEDAVLSSNQQRMEAARQAFRRGDHPQVLKILEDYAAPDPVFDPEMGLLRLLSTLEAARQALEEQRVPYALELLDRAAAAEKALAFPMEELKQRRLLLRFRAVPGEAAALAPQLPNSDEALLLRARAALQKEDFRRAAQYLDGAEDQESTAWNLLRGEAALRAGDWALAAQHYHRAEENAPREAYPALEQCYLAMEDYKQAYSYARKQREI